MRKAVFLDKDGVINRLIEREGMPDGHVTSPWTLQEFKDTIYPYTKDSITKLKDLGFMVFVVTNQPGVLDGDMYMVELDNICEHLEVDFGVDHVLYALKKGTSLYKPNAGMIESLVDFYEVDLPKSYMVGDRWKDIVPGNKSGLTTILVGNAYQYNPPEEYSKFSKPNYIVADLQEAVMQIELLENR